MSAETTSYKRNRSSGLWETGQWKTSEGDVYSKSGTLLCPVLGLVRLRVSDWKHSNENGSLIYSAECGFHGFNIDVRDERSGTLSHRSLARWAWKHAIPAMRQHAMEIV